MILTALDDVRPGMILGVGLRNKEGHTLLGPGVTLSASYLGRLRALGYWAIWIDDEDTRDIPYEDMLGEKTRLAATEAVRDTFALTSRETAAFRTMSSDEVRSALENHNVQRSIRDDGSIERLTGQVDNLVADVLNRAVLTGLGSIRTHSSHTYQHCLDVAVTATMLGRVLGYDRDTLRKLAIGCLVHDIGYIFEQTETFEKESLTEAELLRVRDHTVLGYLFVRDTLRLGTLPAHIAYQHHERQDGTGYPRGLTGTNRILTGAELHVPNRITPMGEIAGIADVHDALSSDRPWRPPMPPDKVWRMVHEAGGSHLNRAMVEELLQILPPYPLGTQVLVTSGPYKDHVGVVARLHPTAIWRPAIRVLRRPGGDPMPPRDIDLRRDDADIQGVLSLSDARVTATLTAS